MHWLTFTHFRIFAHIRAFLAFAHFLAQSSFQPWVFVGEVVGAIDKAGFVHGAHEHLKSDDGIDDDDEDDEQGDLDQGKESHHDGVEHNLRMTFVFQVDHKTHRRDQSGYGLIFP